MSSTDNVGYSLNMIGVGATTYRVPLPATPSRSPVPLPWAQCPTPDLLNLDCVGPTNAPCCHGDRGAPWLLIDDPAAVIVG